MHASSSVLRSNSCSVTSLCTAPFSVTMESLAFWISVLSIPTPSCWIEWASICRLSTYALVVYAPVSSYVYIPLRTVDYLAPLAMILTERRKRNVILLSRCLWSLSPGTVSCIPESTKLSPLALLGHPTEPTYLPYQLSLLPWYPSTSSRISLRSHQNRILCIQRIEPRCMRRYRRLVVGQTEENWTVLVLDKSIALNSRYDMRYTSSLFWCRRFTDTFVKGGAFKVYT